MPLDPDDPRPPYQQVAGELRAAILSRKLLPGEKLPSGAELAREYGVARMTVLQAIRLLRDDSLVVTRQGSGVFVRVLEDRPGARHHVTRAFKAEHVSLDYAGLSGSCLEDALTEVLEQIRGGRLRPRSVTLRALVPDGDRPWLLPGRHDGGGDDPQLRRQRSAATSRSLDGVIGALRDATDRGLVGEVRAEVRLHPLVPLFRLYVLNGAETLFGFYPVEERVADVEGQERAVLDLVADDESLLHSSGDDPESASARHVAQARRWFDSVWTSLARAAG